MASFFGLTVNPLRALADPSIPIAFLVFAVLGALLLGWFIKSTRETVA